MTARGHHGLLLGGAASPVTDGIAYPLTYDEQDWANALTWARQGNGPHVTPRGFRGDGFEARYRATSGLPSWLTTTTDGLCLHATVDLEGCDSKRNSEGDIVVAVCENDATAETKLGLSVYSDIQDATLPHLVVHCYTNARRRVFVARKNWAFGFRFPLLTSGGQTVRPQALHFLDADTVLVTGHYNETFSRCYKVRLSDGASLGFFDFPAPYVHVASATERTSDGTHWFGDFATGMLLRVDLDASFIAGTAQIDVEYDCSVLSGFGAIEWVEDGANEYLLAAEYLTTGTPYLYVIDPDDVVDAGTFATGDRIKRFACSQRAQGVNFDSGKLFMSMNRLTADGTAVGKIQRYDILTAIASLADGGTLTAEQTWIGPSQYVEDIDFHPTSGNLWMQTEGRASVADEDGFLSAWESDLDAESMVNHVTAWTPGSSSDVTVRVNGKTFSTTSFAGGSISAVPAVISVGGPPAVAATTAGQVGYFIGYVRDIVIQSSDLTPEQYAYAVAGNYELNTLTEHVITLTNPNANVDASGWTNEVGSIGRRTSNPLPYEGAGYFFGGANAQTISRERFSVETITGLTGGQIDAATMWARVEWRQASFGGTDDDVGAMGLRCLDGTPTQQTVAYAILAEPLPAQTWFQRGFSAAIPSGCRNLDVLYRSDRNSGTNNDGYIDAISAVIYQQ